MHSPLSANSTPTLHINQNLHHAANLLYLHFPLTHSQVQVPAGAAPVSVQHLELAGDSWTAEVDGRRLKGSALLFTHAGEQVLTVWQDGKSYEFR